MCYGCFEECGKPQIQTIEVGRVAFMAQQMWAFGACHIVVDDWNVEDEHIDSCLALEDCKPSEANFLRHLKSLPTEDERISALALADGYWGDEGEFTCRVSLQQ